MNFDYVTAFFAVGLLGIAGYFVYNLLKPTVTRRAKVTGKRRFQGVSTAKCTFEFEDGTRDELDVSLDTYASLTEGDEGELKTRGLVFWGFRPDREGPKSTSIPEEPLAQIKDALRRGQKIDAIRLYREHTGAGLAEAKTAVEQLEAELSSEGGNT
jgi:hypothetical protein